MADDTTYAQEKPVEVDTACGGRILLTPKTSHAVYQDEVVYFCMPDCKENYLKDPLNSCLAGRIFLDRG